MMPAQLKETTMDPAKRTLLKVVLLADDREGTADSVERLMGTKAEARFAHDTDISHRCHGVWLPSAGILGRVATESAC